MSNHTFTSKITGNLTFRLLMLEGQAVNFAPDGTGITTVNVIGPLNIAALVQGPTNAQWTLTISEGATPLVSETRTITTGINDSFTKTITLLPTAAAASKAQALSLTAGKGGSKKGGSKKDGSKKRGSKKEGSKKRAGKSGRKGGGR